MAGLWTDLQLAAILIVFLYLTQWAIGTTGSKKVGIMIAIIVTYLTVYRHFIILIIVMIVFFGSDFFPNFEQVIKE